MKKVITACALGLFLAAGIIGCSSSTSSSPATSPATKKMDTPAPEKDKDKKDKM